MRNLKEYKEISLLNFAVEGEVIGNFWKLKDVLKGESDEVVLGASLIRSGYVLPGLRVLYRNLSIDNARKVFSSIVLTPRDIANVFFQTVSLSDVKLNRFISSLGIFNSYFNVESIIDLGIDSVILNGIADDIVSTKFFYNHNKYYVNYYTDNDRNFVVLLNGVKFTLPKEIIDFVEGKNFSINLKSVFDFGFPDERVFFEVKKNISEDSRTPYFDPMLKIDFLLSRIEANKFVDFFSEFIRLISTDFDLVNKSHIKRAIIEHLKSKNVIWLLLEAKNVISFLYNQNPTTTLRNLNRNIEMFLSNNEYDIVFRSNRIKIITPIVDVDKYLGDTLDYVKTVGDNRVILISHNNEIKVFLKGNGIPIGKINPNTARLMSELEGMVVSSSLVINESQQVNVGLPNFFKLWVEIDIVKV